MGRRSKRGPFCLRQRYPTRSTCIAKLFLSPAPPILHPSPNPRASLATNTPRAAAAAAAPPISSPANLPDSSWHHAALIDSLSPARGPCPPRPRLACPRPLGAGVRADAGGGRPHSGQDCALRGGTQSGNQGLPCPHPGGRVRAGACGRAWARACGSFRSPHARANQPRSLLWLNHPCAVQRGTYTRSRENRIWGCPAEAGVARRLGDGGPFHLRLILAVAELCAPPTPPPCHVALPWCVRSADADRCPLAIRCCFRIGASGTLTTTNAVPITYNPGSEV